MTFSAEDIEALTKYPMSRLVVREKPANDKFAWAVGIEVGHTTKFFLGLVYLKASPELEDVDDVWCELSDIYA